MRNSGCKLIKVLLYCVSQARNINTNTGGRGLSEVLRVTHDRRPSPCSTAQPLMETLVRLLDRLAEADDRVDMNIAAGIASEELRVIMAGFPPLTLRVVD